MCRRMSGMAGEAAQATPAGTVHDNTLVKPLELKSRVSGHTSANTVNRNALLNRVIMVEVEKEAAEPRPARACVGLSQVAPSRVATSRAASLSPLRTSRATREPRSLVQAY